jgi:hypothetical protein
MNLRFGRKGVRPGLPDGVFSNKKFKFWCTFEGLEGKEYFVSYMYIMTIWYFEAVLCI